MGIFNVRQKDTFSPSKDMENGSKGRQPDKEGLQLDLVRSHLESRRSCGRLDSYGTSDALRDVESFDSHIFFEKEVKL